MRARWAVVRLSARRNCRFAVLALPAVETLAAVLGDAVDAVTVAHARDGCALVGVDSAVFAFPALRAVAGVGVHLSKQVASVDLLRAIAVMLAWLQQTEVDRLGAVLAGPSGRTYAGDWRRCKA